MGRGREGWKPVACSRNVRRSSLQRLQLPARWSAAAIGCPPSSIFMGIHERAAPNGAAVRPAVATDPLLHPRVPSPTHGPRLCAASCRRGSLGHGRILPWLPAALEHDLKQELSLAPLPCSGHPLLVLCQEPAPGLPSEGDRGWGSRWSQGSVLAPGWGLLAGPQGAHPSPRGRSFCPRAGCVSEPGGNYF